MGKREVRYDSPLASVVAFWNYADTVDMQLGKFGIFLKWAQQATQGELFDNELIYRLWV